MVKVQHLLPSVLAIVISAAIISSTNAQRVYHLEREWAKIWINQDRSIDLFYNISITLSEGSDINYVMVGQPQAYSIGQAKDQYGHILTVSDASSGSDFKARVAFHSPLRSGETIWFTLTTTVSDMIKDDPQNPGNVGMEFTPTWWREARVNDLQILIVLPENVTRDEVRTSVDWDNTLMEGEQLAIYWERKNLLPNENYTVGVSFPEEHVGNFEQPSLGLPAILQRYWPIILLPVFFITIIAGAIYASRYKRYRHPRISMESLGIRRGLTAVEASYLLEMEPTRVVTAILYGLLRKRAVWVESAHPSVKLKVLHPADKEGSSGPQLRYYEIDFLNAVRKDGALDEEKLAKTVMFLRDTVEQKLRGYCRRDTIAYYKSIVSKAWQQVEQAGTAEIASKTYDEQLLWLLLDPEHRSRTKEAFEGRQFQPSPLWLWYWYGYQHYHPNPTYKPNVENPGQSASPPTIPGADFANNIASAVENTSNTIVANLTQFANSIIPGAATKASTQTPRQEASCICACASCACVCACVSCACACASGGVG